MSKWLYSGFLLMWGGLSAFSQLPDQGTLSASWYRVKVKSVFKKSSHSQIMVSLEKAANVHHQYKTGICMTSLASHVVLLSCWPAKGSYPGESFFVMVLFPTIAHRKSSLYCQNIELCQCLPTEVWTLDQKPTNQGTGKEITFMCCYWRNYCGLLDRLRCH